MKGALKNRELVRGTTSLAIAFLAFCSGCGHIAERTAADRVTEALPRYLGPAAHYETHISAASTGALMRGRVQSVEVDGTAVQLRPNLLVDHLTLTAQAIEVDRKSGALKSVGSATFSCRISSDHLSHYVSTLRTNIEGLSVRIDGDRLVAKAKPEAFHLIGIPVSVRGEIVPEPGGTLLDFKPDRAAVSIVRLPGAVVDLLAQEINPVVDLSQLPISVRLDSATMSDGVLTLSGSVDPDDILRAAGK